MDDEDEARRAAAEEAAKARRWTLDQTLAWIATRRLEALPHGGAGSRLSVWMAIEEAEGRPSNFPFPNPHDAWPELAGALAEGALAGLGTHVKMTKEGGRTAHSLGVPFPPRDQPGFAQDCILYDDGPTIVAPAGRKWNIAWDEFQSVTFRREDVQKLWREITEIEEAEFIELLAMTDQREGQRTPVLEKDTVADSDAADKPQASKNRGGRKPIYPWADFHRAALEKLEDEGGLDAAIDFTQANLERHMIDWCATHWERQPAESTIRLNVSKARDIHKAGKGR